MAVSGGLLYGGLLVVRLVLNVCASLDFEFEKANAEARRNAGTFCEDYSICLLKLEGQQRECLAHAAHRNNATSTPVPSTPQKNADFATECSQKKRQLRQDIRVLMHRETEITRDCVSKNLHLAEPVLNEPQEQQCRDVAEALKKFTVPVQDVVSAKRHRTSRTRRSTKPGKGNNHCHHHVAELMSKCQVLARCCSISTECGLDAAALHDQSHELKQELHKVKAQCDPSADHLVITRL